ncbi:EAL domain-containing protein [Aromatoleum buckelii]|nr:EAL domain-containing protein [Aromatoleum buckelii]
MKTMRVLYIEDSEADADLARRRLAQRAPEIALEVVTTLQRGLSRLAAQPPPFDVVLSDLHLPDGTGLDLLAHVRMNHLPVAVVVLTGAGNHEAAMAALKAGADAYQVKRDDYLDQLPATLRGALARFRDPAGRRTRPLRVLYGEADELEALRTQRHLAHYAPHIQLTIAASAAEVLARLPATPDAAPDFDVLLFDHASGSFDGAELARVVRHERRLALPLVLVSAHGGEDLVARTMELGVDDFIAKYPGYLHALPATLEKVRERAELIHERAELRATTAHLAHLLSASPTVLYTLQIRDDGKPQASWVSDNIVSILGVSSADALSPGWWLAHVHPDDRAAWIATQTELLREGHRSHEYRLLGGKEQVTWIRDDARVLRDDSGAAVEVVGTWTEITAQKQTELLQAARSAVLNRLIGDDPLPVILDDVARRLESLAPEMRVSILLLDESGTRLVHAAAPNLPAFYVDAIENLEVAEGQGSCGTAMARGEPVFTEDVFADADWDAYRDLARRANFRACWSFPFRDDNGKLLGTFAVYFYRPRPIDPAMIELIGEFSGLTSLAVQKFRAAAALRQTAAVIESTRDGVMVTDLSQRIVSVNRAWCEITGFSEEEALGKTPGMLKSGLQDDAFYRQLWESVAHTGHWQGEIWNRRKNGELYPQWLSVSTVYDEDHNPVRYVGVMTDISQLKQSQAQLERLAHYDPLTDLPNRLLVQSRLEHAIEQAARQQLGLGVLFVDLDRFKNINDSLGHASGDELLVAISWRLRTRLRPEDTLARWGGDEFLVIIDNLRKPDESASVAQNLIDLLREPFSLPDGEVVYVGASVGISLYPQDGTSAAELIQHADAALNQAKAQGRNTFRFFTEALSEAAQRHVDLERRLRVALEQQAFVVHYQPQIDITTGRVTGCEALVRWQATDEGPVSPNRFIPFAEESGLIVPLGEWVLETACRQAREWRDAGLGPLRVGVNLSARQLWQAELPDRIAAILQRTGLPPECLELELTESMIMGHEAQAEQRLGLLKSMGIALAIDDFGTGYSSLAYLKNFPIEMLKIDQGFVRHIPDDRKDMEITAGIIALARKLKIKVLAEGVETDAQLAFLTEQGCDAYQGYLFSRPLPAEDFAQLLVQQAR